MGARGHVRNRRGWLRVFTCLPIHVLYGVFSPATFRHRDYFGIIFLADTFGVAYIPPITLSASTHPLQRHTDLHVGVNSHVVSPTSHKYAGSACATLTNEYHIYISQLTFPPHDASFFRIRETFHLRFPGGRSFLRYADIINNQTVKTLTLNTLTTSRPSP